MSFTSIAFLLMLGPVALVSAGLAGRPRLQNLFLLAFSLFFYGYWDWRFLSLLIASILVDFAVGLRIAAQASPRGKRRWLIVSLVFNLGLLGVFKYYGFFADGLGRLLGTRWPVLHVILPVGISFYTFQSLAYVIDVYRGLVLPERNLLDYALYVAFFPQLEAGPIERATTLLPQIRRPKRPTMAQVREGAYLVLYGLFLKIAVADAAGPLVDYVFAHAATGSWLLLLGGAVGFSLEIYGDFAGYSTIARGCAKLLGVELRRNFDHPYFSTSVTEFWRRWHMSLSGWLRDYLYFPLGGNRLGFGRSLLNLMIVMLLGGLWHGANWTFVVWGGLHGFYLVAHKLILRARGAGAYAGTLPALLKGSLVFLLVSLTWVFFRAPSLPAALDYLGRIPSFQSGEWRGILFQLGVVAAFLLPFEVLTFRKADDAAPLRWPWPARAVLYAFMVWSIAGGIGAQRAFIYFQF